ncbi:MAG: metal ABC transporter substrate-binding protein [Anaerolineales bacterium]|jgi:ABC-type Zn uptake system ZnuABC Zn-binding protein ZnuA
MLPRNLFLIVLLSSLLLVACSGTPTSSADDLNVVASTTIIGDVVRMVGGEQIELTVLFPVDADPHSFSPVPKVIAEIETADVVFINGFGLEEALEELIVNTAVEEVVSVSEGIIPLEFDAGSGESEEEHEHEHHGDDPHVWMSPLNVKIWADNIAEALGELDPVNSEVYRSNLENYQSELDGLHSWILEQVAQIPQDDRLLITDHDTMSYFAVLYDFETIGVILPGGGTLAEPSAQDIAQLEDTITSYQVPAIFVGTTVNTQLAERISRDTGVQLVPLYAGSLSSQDGPASTYIKLMRHNVSAIVSALKA